MADAVERSEEVLEIDAVCRYEADTGNRIEVPNEVWRYHPIIAHSRVTFKKRSHPDRYHRLYTPAEDVFEVNVSKLQVSRAFRIADTLLKVLERRGWRLSSEAPQGCRATLFGQAVTLSIVETSKRIPYEPTPEQRRDFERTGYRWYQTIDFQPTGRLRLCGDRHLYSSGVEVVDTAGRPLEERLNEFVVLLTRCAWQHRCDELERAERQRQWAIEEARRRDKEARAARAQQAVENLKAQARRHDDAQAIRAFVTAVRDRADVSDLDAWSTWALDVAARLDPATEGQGDFSLVDAAARDSED